MIEDAEKVVPTGSPSADWTGLTGLAGDIHYVESGAYRLHSISRIRIAELKPQTKTFYSDRQVANSHSVEVVNSETDETSGLLQAPSIRTEEITPTAPGTDVNLLSLNYQQHHALY